MVGGALLAITWRGSSFWRNGIYIVYTSLKKIRFCSTPLQTGDCALYIFVQIVIYIVRIHSSCTHKLNTL